MSPWMEVRYGERREPDEAERLREVLRAAINDEPGWRRSALEVLGVQWDQDPKADRSKT